MNNPGNWIVLGRFGRAHGVKGLITVHSFTEPRENILHYPQWHALINKQWQPLNRLRVEVTDKCILVLVEGVSAREQLSQLTNVDIAVPKEQLPVLEPGEFYWHQLIGMQVVNQQGEALGEVVEMLATGSNDVLVVNGSKQLLIPYLPGGSVIHVDLGRALITVDWDMDF